MKDWQWRFGETPKFSHHMEEKLSWGHVDVHLNCRYGVIEEAKMFSDSLQPSLIDLLEHSLSQQKYQPEELQRLFAAMQEEHPTYKDEIKEFSQWLCQEIT
jgi:lipoate-protein ligase A